MSKRPDPHEVVVVDEQSVRVSREFRDVLCSRVTPPLDHVALGVELDHDGSRHTARAERRILDGRDLLGRERLGEMGDPNVILRVHKDRGDGTHDPLVGHLERPRRVDRKRRDVTAGIASARCLTILSPHA